MESGSDASKFALEICIANCTHVFFSLHSSDPIRLDTGVLFSEIKAGFFPQASVAKSGAVFVGFLLGLSTCLSLSLCGWVLVEAPNTAGLMTEVEVGLWGVCTKDDVPSVFLVEDSKLTVVRVFVCLLTIGCCVHFGATIATLMATPKPNRPKEKLGLKKRRPALF